MRRNQGQVVNFKLRLKPRLTTKQGTVLSYLQDADASDLSTKERIMMALMAFWLAPAARLRGGMSADQLRHLAEESLYHLKLHVRYLEEAFGLDADTQSHERQAAVREALNAAWSGREVTDEGTQRALRPRRDGIVSFSFRTQPRLWSREGMVLHFLNNYEESFVSRRERVIRTLVAVWLAPASRYRGDFLREELQQIARDSVYDIGLHQEYLQSSFQVSAAAQSGVPSDRHQKGRTVSPADETDDDLFDMEDSILASWM